MNPFRKGWQAVLAAVLLAFVPVLSGCEDDPSVNNEAAPVDDDSSGDDSPQDDSANLEGVSFNSTGVTLYAPDTISLTVEGTFDDGTVADILSAVTLSSSDTNVATIDGQGVVAAVAPGTATLTATEPESGLSASVGVTVPGYAIQVSGSITTIAGSLDATDNTWDRPDDPCVSGAAGTYYYDSFLLRNTSGADQTIDVFAQWSNDGYLFVYSLPFDAGTPLVGCLESDDDDDSTRYSRTTTTFVAAGSEVQVVATAFSTFTATGPYYLDVISTPAPNPMTTIFTHDTGTFTGGWTATGLWSVRTGWSWTGTYSAQYNDGTDYDTGVANSGELKSPEFTLTGAGVLEFVYRLDNECAFGVVCANDKLTVEISTNSGATWTVLDDLPDTSSGSNYRTIDLSAYLGQSVQVRLFFNTGDDFANAYPGAFIDSIVIY
jgi:hypothetical protein